MGRVCFERNKYVAVENNGSYTIFTTRHCIIVSVVCCFFHDKKVLSACSFKIQKTELGFTCGKDFRTALTQRRAKKKDFCSWNLVI